MLSHVHTMSCHATIRTMVDSKQLNGTWKSLTVMPNLWFTLNNMEIGWYNHAALRRRGLRDSCVGGTVKKGCQTLG